MTEPPTETQSILDEQPEDVSMYVEPPNTEALLATVRQNLQHSHGMYVECKPCPPHAALDAIASELERLTACEADQRRGASYEKDRADTALARLHAAEAELERVRAERELLREEGDVILAQLRADQARLDRAVEALRAALSNEYEWWKKAEASLADIGPSAVTNSASEDSS